MAKRYDQFCPIAHALSLVGERWSLLVVRELLKGPRRYTDLAGGLPGIGTNILATRLRELEAGGVVRKRKLPPPVASTVYELTEYGAGLEEAIHAIARWGARSLGPPESDDVSIPSGGSTRFPALLYPERARGLTETYVIGVDASTFTVRLEDGSLTVELGAADDADLVAHMDMPTVFALASGDVPDRRGGRAGPRRPPARATPRRSRGSSTSSASPRESRPRPTGATPRGSGRGCASRRPYLSLNRASRRLHRRLVRSRHVHDARPRTMPPVSRARHAVRGGVRAVRRRSRPAALAAAALAGPPAVRRPARAAPVASRPRRPRLRHWVAAGEREGTWHRTIGPSPS